MPGAYANASSLRIYDYDGNANVIELGTESNTRTFTYDAVNRLTREALNGVEIGIYAYDANGNRTSSSAEGNSFSYTYTPTSNLLVGINGSPVGRDQVGRRISDRGGVRTFTYTPDGRLHKVHEHGAWVATYFYNAFGQRSRKETPTGITLYHYDLDGRLISETRPDGAALRDYVWTDAAPLAQIEAKGGGVEQVAYLHTDTLGTPRAATDAVGRVTWSWEGDAFGADAGNEDPDGDGTTTQVNLRFPGQYYDQETGLHYNYFRYYDPAVGRYITSDPIGLNGGLNTFAYVSSNPLGNADPFGLYELRAWPSFNSSGGVDWNYSIEFESMSKRSAREYLSRQAGPLTRLMALFGRANLPPAIEPQGLQCKSIDEKLEAVYVGLVDGTQNPHGRTVGRPRQRSTFFVHSESEMTQILHALRGAESRAIDPTAHNLCVQCYGPAAQQLEEAKAATLQHFGFAEYMKRRTDYIQRFDQRNQP